MVNFRGSRMLLTRFRLRLFDRPVDIVMNGPALFICSEEQWL